MSLSTLLVFFTLLLVITTLIIGIVNMAIGGKFNQKHSTQLMSVRLIFQYFAILLMLTVLML